MFVFKDIVVCFFGEETFSACINKLDFGIRLMFERTKILTAMEVP